MPNYNNGKIYCLRSHQTDDVYYGSTTQKKLAVRKGGHRSNYKRWLNGKGNYVTSFELVKYDDCYIELVELYPCTCKGELDRREGEIIRDNECVNKIIAGRTRKEYRIDNVEKIKEDRKKYRLVNTDKIKEYDKEYYLNNADKLKEYQKGYRLNNIDKIKGYYLANIDKIKEYTLARKKVKITCICGSIIQKRSKSEHERTQKHQNFLKANPQPE